MAILLTKTFEFDPKDIVKINIQPNWKQLYGHPYIGPQRAKILHAFFTQRPQLTKADWEHMQGLDAEEKEKIEPYIAFTKKP